MHPKPAGPPSCGAAQALKEIPLYEVSGAVHPKSVGPRRCGAAHNDKIPLFVTRGPCILNPRACKLAVPRKP